MYQTILFDLDGTLTDPGEGITNAVAYALHKYGIEVTDRTTLYPFIGPPLKESFEGFYGFSPEQAEQAVAYYREHFRDIGIFENVVYDGAEELLAAVKAAGKKIILATSKPEEFARRILEHFGLTGYFDGVYGSCLDGTRRHKDEVIAHALADSGITDLSGVVMVGDREQDVLGAAKNNLPTIGVLYGYGSREELTTAGATHIVESVEELKQYLLKA